MNTQTLNLKILSYDGKHHQYITDQGQFDPFVSCTVPHEDWEKYIGKTVRVNGFFHNGVFLPSGRENEYHCGLTVLEKPQEA